MTNPLVSVITPSYDRPQHLRQAIGTVTKQTYGNIEHIIVDDNSTTPIDENIRDRNDVTIHRHKKNKGASAARNTGADIADGRYIAFLDDDDEWYPEKIQLQVSKAEETGAGVVYTGIEEKLEGDVFATHTPNLNGDITRELLTKPALNSTSTVLVNSAIFDKVGGFDTHLPNNQDWDFYIRASTITDFASIPIVLATYHHHEDGQISGNYTGKRDITIPRMLEKHGEMAKDLNLQRQFTGSLEWSLGVAALNAERYPTARGHFYRSLRLRPTKEAAVRFVALILGGLSYRPARRIRRALATQ